MQLDAKQIAALKDELRRDLEALERVERLMAFKSIPVTQPDARPMVLPVVPKPQVDIETAEEDTEGQPTTSLRGKIAEIINSDPTIRWTTQKMLTHLQATNFPLRAQKPIYSVGQTLATLVEQGRIRLVRKGTGSQPNIYRGTTKELGVAAADTMQQSGGVAKDSTTTH